MYINNPFFMVYPCLRFASDLFESAVTFSVDINLVVFVVVFESLSNIESFMYWDYFT